jgi:hypothetical protein
MTGVSDRRLQRIEEALYPTEAKGTLAPGCQGGASDPQ